MKNARSLPFPVVRRLLFLWVLRLLTVSAAEPLCELGPLPDGLVPNWPAAPITTREVSVVSAAAFDAEAGIAGTRIRVAASFTDSVFISANDIDVVFGPGVSVGNITVLKDLRRLRFQAGTASRIELLPPTQYWPEEVTDPAWLIEDVTIDRMRLTSTDGSGLLLRGRRIAVLRCASSVHEYSVWIGAPDPAKADDNIRAEDIIIAHNRFASAGREATVRIHDANRVIVVGNRLTNGDAATPESKHNLRLHGTIHLAFAARNTLVHSGFMAGIALSGDYDLIERLWLHDNHFHQLRPSLIQMEPGFMVLADVRGNHIHSDLHSAPVFSAPPATWSFSGNTFLPYQAHSIGNPEITDAAPVPGGFFLGWDSATTVHVQRRSALTDGEWETISTDNPFGSFLDTPPSGDAFYRIAGP